MTYPDRQSGDYSVVDAFETKPVSLIIKIAVLLIGLYFPDQGGPRKCATPLVCELTFFVLFFTNPGLISRHYKTKSGVYTEDIG